MTEKETLTAQRDALERRKLRSSQAAARDIVSLSLQIDSIESALSVKMKGQLHAPEETERHFVSVRHLYSFKTSLSHS